MRNIFTIVPISMILLGCQVQQTAPVVADQESDNSNLSIRVLSDAEVSAGGTPPVDQQRFLADILYEALQALGDDRLLTPIDDNAHARFKRVLA